MLDEMTPKIKAVQKMQDYIAAHQTEEINLSDLANTACYSPWYCYRIFKELTEMETRNVFIQVIKKPARKVIIKRGQKATEYFAYCEEVGCDIWGLLTSKDSMCGERGYIELVAVKAQ